MARVSGTVKFFKDERADGQVEGTGYGFIMGDDGREVFVHRSALGRTCSQKSSDLGARYVIYPDQRVTYEVAPSDKGNGLKAARVELITAEGI